MSSSSSALQQRFLNERLKLTKGLKLADELLPPKLSTLKLDLTNLHSIYEKYFHFRNTDFPQHYRILNIKEAFHRGNRNVNKEIYSSITSLDDIPAISSINTNLIQPIINYESFYSQLDAKFAKMLARNSLVASTIKQYCSQRKNSSPPAEEPPSEEPPEEQKSKQSKRSIRLRLDSAKPLPSNLQSFVSDVINLKLGPLTYGPVVPIGPKSVPARPSLLSVTSCSQKNLEKEKLLTNEAAGAPDSSDHTSVDVRRIISPTNKASLRPIDYQSVCFGDSKPQIVYPYVKKSQKETQSSQSEPEKLGGISITNLPILGDQSKVQRAKRLGNIQKSQRYHTSSEKEEHASIQELPGAATLRQQIPLLNKGNLQPMHNGRKLPKPEQLLSTLIASGVLRSKYSELCEQYLQPIKISSQIKILTPKDKQLISKSKQRQLMLEAKIFNLK